MLLSNFLRNSLLDALLRGQAAYAPPQTLYVALFTSEPAADGSGTEASGSGYARASIASSLANWAGTQGAGTSGVSTGTSGATSNNNAITFGAPTGSWGTIVGAALYDAPTGGNMLFFGSLTTALAVNNGDPAPSFAAGALKFILT